MKRSCSLCLLPMLLLCGSALGQNDYLNSSLESDQAALKAAFLDHEPATLLDYLAKRSQKTLSAEAATPVLEQLKSADKAQRDKAAGEIVKFGPLIKPALQQFVNNAANKDVIAQARECLKLLGEEEITASVIRSVGRANPKGGIEALLAFLPFTASEDQREETYLTLLHLSAEEGKANDQIVTALKDEHPLRRGTAAMIICHVGSNKQIEAVRALVEDPKPTVRLQVAMGLIKRYDPESVPTLISLLGSLPAAQRKQCEETLNDLAGEWKIGLPLGEDVVSEELRKGLWSAWWNAIKAETLIRELEKRTPTNDERTAIVEAIKSLSAPAADEREKAVNRLSALGLKSLTLLKREASKEESKSAETVRRLVEQMSTELPKPLPAVAIRILAMKKHPKVAEVLLQYLPYSATDEMEETAYDAIPWIAARDESSWPTLVKALDSPLQARRLVAVRALAKIPDKQEIARKLLKDDNLDMRLGTALALANEQDKQAIPVLIALLSEGSLDQAKGAEEYLLQLSGPTKPTVELGEAAAERTKCREAWTQWWQANGDKVKLARISVGRRTLGYTLIVENYNSTLGAGRVLELDRDGKVRWQITGLQYPLHAQVLKRDRVLICEQSMNRVRECDFKGNTLWSYNVSSPRFCKRLKNGNTAIAYSNRLIQVDKDGKQVKNVQLPDYVYTYGAEMTDNGDFVYVSSGYQYRRVDKDGKLKTTFPVPNSPLGGSRYPAILKNGNMLVSFYSERKVKEYDDKGKLLREFPNVNAPTMGNITPKGTAIVGSLNLRKIVEVDAKGKQIREFSGNYYPWKVYRR